ncbi:DUF3159 domain-containing protein [Microbacterium excoecariae]|uniref:DUF3159 domain-containing protein n=1 Tax=Microbacterium excoecariae TaxID=2715210 RepID=UPI0014099E4C|nr:DUF3159 domain-containing protein [Microbacterium excoecariae]NHI17167.1 DUF3159 domain-containing protein [Microbacterium excoecariae]
MRQAEPERPEDEHAAPSAISAALGGAARRAGLDPATSASTGHVVWAAMGGVRGIFESVVPLVVFLVSLTVWRDQLWLAVGCSVGAAAVFTVIRLAQRQPPSAALGGLIAVGVAGALVLFTGRAEDNFIPGFVTNILYGSAFLISALARWSLIGLAVGFLMDEGTAWRRDRRKRRAFRWLAIMWAALFFGRFAVQFPMWLAGVDVQTLGMVKLVMGIPLFAPLVAVTWLSVRALYPRGGGGARADTPTS